MISSIHRTLFCTLATLALVAGPAAANPPIDHIAPNFQITTGAAATTDTNEVCRSGYEKARGPVPESLRAQAYRDYGIDSRKSHYQIDRLIPASLGGADVAANLWPESLDLKPWNATAKDRLEIHLHELVCSGKLPLKQAQKEIADDWIAAYETYIGPLDNVHG